MVVILDVKKRVRVMVFNTTFNNISVIFWRSVLLSEETGVPCCKSLVLSTPHHDMNKKLLEMGMYFHDAA